MRIDQAEVVVRPRSPWEAIDLGFALVRHYRRAVYSTWGLTAVPASALVLLILHDHVGWAFFAIWILKALFDRVPLYVLSRAIFGATPGLSQTLRALPRMWTRHLLSALLFYRFQPARSYLLPVAELEGMRGLRRGKRERLLLRKGSTQASILTFTCLLFELALVLSAAGFAWFLIPGELEPDWSSLVEGPDGEEWRSAFGCVAVVLYVLSSWLIGPAYVAGGFALYLDRRIHLEGWDVDIAFRRIVERLGRSSSDRVAVAAPTHRGRGRIVAGLLLATLLWPAVRLGAQDSVADVSGVPTRDPRRVVEEILQHSDFDTVVTKEVWDLPDFLESEGSRESGGTFGGLAVLLEAALWLLAIAAAVFIGTRLFGNVGWFAARRDREEDGGPLTRAFGLDVRRESLPADVPGTAWALWQAGDFTGATGLLYRAAIATLIDRDGLTLRESDTEIDCLEEARHLLMPSRAHYFEGVTDAWQTCAYSGTRPDSPRIRALCDGWSEEFDVVERRPD